MKRRDLLRCECAATPLSFIEAEADVIETRLQDAALYHECMKRRRTVTRWVIAAMLLLIGGAVVNVGVAILCSTVFSVDATAAFRGGADGTQWFDSSKPFRHTSWEVRSRTELGSRFTSSLCEWCGDLEMHAMEVRGHPPEVLVPVWARELMPSQFGNVEWGGAIAIAREAGWPCYTLGGTLQSNKLDEKISTSSSAAYLYGEIDWRPGWFPLNQFVPMRPIWPGFLINTLFYAAILWTLFIAPFALRRKRRRRRGLCPACAYPIGTSDVCTECGEAVVSPNT